ncbi:MAG: SDR family NAD(P)-dependent oxidoreductase [Candidatus Dormibacteraeota bacterium]|nr:SDR family NAD(P)-dependent oxidoreductase [Candidatus Dormibacteraeota bacterium]
MRLRDSVVLITGASSGIGQATARAFARRGARLALCARRVDRLQAVAEQCRADGSPRVTTTRADLCRREDASAFVAAALRDHDRLDVLVNNAGLGWSGRLLDMPAEKAEELVQVNILGVLWTTQSALPQMIEQGGGVIINVGSIVGFRAAPYSAIYSATKHAVTGLSHALRGELNGTGVKVCTVYPAVTRSEFFSVSGGRESGPVYSADWVARLVVRTARFPRRDAIVFPWRVADLAEPIFGGLIDRVLGMARRRTQIDSTR